MTRFSHRIRCSDWKSLYNVIYIGLDFSFIFSSHQFIALCACMCVYVCACVAVGVGNVTQLTIYIDVNIKWTLRPTSRQLEKILMINAKNGKFNRMHHILYSFGNFMNTKHTHANNSEFSKKNRYMNNLGWESSAWHYFAKCDYRNKNCGLFRIEYFTTVGSIDFRTIRVWFEIIYATYS